MSENGGASYIDQTTERKHHGADQITSFPRDSRSSCFAVTDLPSPIPAKSFPMPIQDRLRLDDDYIMPFIGHLYMAHPA